MNGMKSRGTPKMKVSDMNEKDKGSPEFSDTFQHIHNHRALVHQSMVSTLNNLYTTSVFTHRTLHPPHSILCDLFIPVTVPYLHLVGIICVGESPRTVVVIENLQEIAVRASGCFSVRGRDQGIA